MRAFAHALRTDWMVWGGCHGEVCLKIGHFPSRWQKEVHQCCGFAVAHLIICNLLAKSHGEGFGQTPMNLPFNDHRVDPRATIVKRIKAFDRWNTGVHVDIHDANVSAERIGHVWRIIVADCFQTWFQTGDSLIVSCIGNFAHCLKPLRCAFDHKTIHVKLNVIVVHFEQIGGDHLSLGANFTPRHGGCCTGNRC